MKVAFLSVLLLFIINIAYSQPNYTKFSTNGIKLFPYSGTWEKSYSITDLGLNNLFGIGATGSGTYSYNYGWIGKDKSNNHMVFLSNGNIGIGVTTPFTKLDVAGVITANNGNSNMWSEAFFWGDHRLAGYLKTVGLPANAIVRWDGTQLVSANITDNGNIGIGTTTPSNKLDVVGVISATGGNSNNWNTAYSWGDHRSAGYLQTVGLPANAIVRWDGTQFISANITDNGNIGIGTTDPKAALHIESSTPFLRLSNNNANYLYSGIDGTGLYFEQVADNAAKSKIRLQTRNSNQGDYTQFFIDGGNSKFTFINGNVGIGTTTPNHKLEVNGTIRSKEVLVEASPWPDFVFEPQYKLMPLNELEQFIKDKKHLPGVPTAQHVQENGANLGENQVILLQKIEELTLYILQQQQQINELKQQLLINKKIEN